MKNSYNEKRRILKYALEFMMLIIIFFSFTIDAQLAIAEMKQDEISLVTPHLNNDSEESIIVFEKIIELGGRLTGNIVLTDRASNLVGVLTIAVWMLTGRKDRFLKIFPLPGISAEDIEAAERFGAPLASALTGERFALDQNELNNLGAVRVQPSLLIMEKRISKIFAIWSRFIRLKGGPGAPSRRRRVRAFMIYLIVAVVLLAPLASVAAAVMGVLKKDQIRAEVEYFSQNALR